jgi:pyruvate dehydrogenase E1 component alpha subunit
MTYRMGPHSTSDDPGRYRSLGEEQAARRSDPLTACENLLRSSFGTPDSFFTDAAAQGESEADAVRAGLEALTSRPGAEMFDFVFQEPTAALKDQAAAWRTESEHV